MSGSLFELPGPRRFVRGLHHRIELGATSTVLLPRAAAPRGLRRAVLPHASPDQVRVLQLSSMSSVDPRPIAVCLADVLDIQRPVGARVDITSLATADSLGSRVVWVEADSRTSHDLIAEWFDLAGQFAQAAKNVPVTDRPTLVTVISGHHMSIPASHDDVDVIWWWGVLDRLDTDVHVAERTHGNTTVSPDVAAMIVELAGHDLNLADTLVEDWRGDPEHACSLLVDHAQRRGWKETSAPPAVGRQRPPFDGLESWHLGALESWLPDGPGLHVACDPSLERAVHGRMWRAQIRTVYPRIEQLRQSLAEWVAANTSHLPDKWSGADPFALEIGQMKELIESAGVLRHDRSRLKSAQWGSRVRNRLSHLDPVPASELAEGDRLLASVVESLTV